jgi:hypothetical protein
VSTGTNYMCCSAIWVWRGQGLAFELAEDWQVDYASYAWQKLDPKVSAVSAFLFKLLTCIVFSCPSLQTVIGYIGVKFWIPVTDLDDFISDSGSPFRPGLGFQKRF